jgi:cytoskeletal protein CcmA (bactofilin family)
MFRRRNPPGDPPRPDPAGAAPPAAPTGFQTVPPAPPAADAASARQPLDRGLDMTNTPRPTPPTPGSPYKPDIPRRVVDIPPAPGAAPRRPESASSPQVEMRKLIVGRDISLSGEIAACDVLVVEGTVEARLRDGRNIEISETGLFKGSVEIDEADIAGRFEGEITVRGRLKVRAGGRIQGSIRYGELEVEAGGQLSGDIQVIGAQPARAGVRPTPAPVREPAPMAEEPRAAAGIEA